MMLTEDREGRRVHDDHSIGDEVFKKIVVTHHTDDKGHRFTACTAVHCQDFERRIGGVRFVNENFQGNLEEVAHLASAMTWKTALCGLPVDGEKSVVYCHGSIPDTTEQKAEVLAAHLAVLREEDPGVIFGPDMDCDERVMSALAHDHDLGEHVAGLTEGRGGFSIDEHGFTASGLDSAISKVASLLKWDLSTMTASIEGFGAVGAHTARLLAERGVQIVAASIKKAALRSDDGLPVKTLFAGWKRGRDKAFLEFRKDPPSGVEAVDQDAVFEVRADIFVPAARTDRLMMRDELHDSAIAVEAFYAATGVRAVLQGANHPVSKRAEGYLVSKGVQVLPDYLVNGGGLIGCWIDWCQRETLLRGSDEEQARLRAEALDFIHATTRSNVARAMEAGGDQPVDLRQETDRLAQDAKAAILRDFDQGGGSVEDQRRRATEFLQTRLEAVSPH